MATTESGASADHRATKLVCFYLGGQEYGADIADVKETMVVRPITRVFLTPPWLTGIINLRGDVVAVLDLAQLLGQEPTSVSADSRIVIVHHRDDDGRTRSAGVLVDRMAELRNLEPGALAPPPPTLAATTAALLAGVATVDRDRPLGVLDIAALFGSDGVRAFQRRP